MFDSRYQVAPAKFKERLQLPVTQSLYNLNLSGTANQTTNQGGYTMPVQSETRTANNAIDWQRELQSITNPTDSNRNPPIIQQSQQTFAVENNPQHPLFDNSLLIRHSAEALSRSAISTNNTERFRDAVEATNGNRVPEDSSNQFSQPTYRAIQPQNRNPLPSENTGSGLVGWEHESLNMRSSEQLNVPNQTQIVDRNSQYTERLNGHQIQNEYATNYGPTAPRNVQSMRFQPREPQPEFNQDRYANVDRTDRRREIVQPQIYYRDDQHDYYREGPRMNDARYAARGNRSNRNTVPVNHWRVSFSGDGQGMHLFEFLSQVRMLQQSEMLLDHELLPMMVHLFTGRAKNWYGMWAGTFQTWEELTDALTTEFLPTNYRYMLLENITNRKQKSSESIGEFMALMMSLFRWLDVPLDEQHKVYIVRNNLLPRYMSGVAPFRIVTLAQLAQVCRQVESASQSANIGLPFENPYHQVNRGGYGRPRMINEIKEVEDLVEEVFNGEICNVRRQQQRQQSGSSGISKCFNCDRNGHSFRDCTTPRNGVFCYSCGVKNVTTRNCTRCSGNEQRGVTDRASQRFSQEARTNQTVANTNTSTQ